MGNDIEQDRLKTAQWILERNLAWVASADVKVGVLVAIETAMLGGLGSVYSSASSKPSLFLLFTVIAAVTSVLGLVCAALAAMPRTSGPESSLLFFGPISRMSSADYVDRLQRASSAELLADCGAQIHRNAEIAASKHAWVRKAMGWSFASSLPWVGAMVRR